MVRGQPEQIVHKTLSEKYPIQKRASGVAQVVECLELVILFICLLIARITDCSTTPGLTLFPLCDPNSHPISFSFQ
jgi:hypothetical protein